MYIAQKISKMFDVINESHNVKEWDSTDWFLYTKLQETINALSYVVNDVDNKSCDPNLTFKFDDDSTLDVGNFKAEVYTPMMYPHEPKATEEDEELALFIRRCIDWDDANNKGYLDELCKRAGLEKEWKDADSDYFEEVLEEAAERLHVSIY